MAETSKHNGSIDKNELRHRLPQDPGQPQHAPSAHQAQEAVHDMNVAEDESKKDDTEKRTYGRTLDGTGTLHCNI